MRRPCILQLAIVLFLGGAAIGCTRENPAYAASGAMTDGAGGFAAPLVDAATGELLDLPLPSMPAPHPMAPPGPVDMRATAPDLSAGGPSLPDLGLPDLGLPDLGLPDLGLPRDMAKPGKGGKKDAGDRKGRGHGDEDER